MLNFQAVREKRITLAELATHLTRHDLRALTNEIVDTVLKLIEDCADEDVAFQPSDPLASDAYAAEAGEANLAWTLGHVIVHTTASSEEAAFIAAELARGVAFHGRSRHETPWQSLTNVAACRQRLEESRRIRLACLEIWPDAPNLELLYTTARGATHNAIGRFLLGLMHEEGHLGQITDIVAQAAAARIPALL